MSNTVETKKEVREITLPGEAGNMEKGALVCDLIMLGVFLWNQIFYGMDMMFFIVFLSLVGAYLVLACVFTEAYCFTETSLEVRHKLRKTIAISYESVFNYEESSHDSFINILQSNRVKVYYTQGKKRMILCCPRDVETFTETLKWNCPEFHEDLERKSKLEVFFANKK